MLSGSRFSAYDRDNDNADDNCALKSGAGWWYDRCPTPNLNGQYHQGAHGHTERGVVWSTYRPPNYSLKRVRMFIRAAAF